MPVFSVAVGSVFLSTSGRPGQVLIRARPDLKKLTLLMRQLRHLLSGACLRIRTTHSCSAGLSRGGDLAFGALAADWGKAIGCGLLMWQKNSWLR